MDLREQQEANPHRHPWELARAAALAHMLPPLPRTAQYADVGSGDLFFTRRVARRLDLPVYAVDPAYAAAAPCDGFVYFSALDAVPAAAVDCVTALDVFEHVKDDAAFARGLRRMLKPGGVALVTVPAHPWLWSPHDEWLGHQRRYDRRRLKSVLGGAGFVVEDMFTFYAVPLLVRCAQMIALRGGARPAMRAGIGAWRWSDRHCFTRGLVWLLRVDFACNRAVQRMAGCSLGLSLCALCKNPSA